MSPDPEIEEVQAYAANVYSHLIGAATIACSDLANKLGFYAHLRDSGAMTAADLAEMAGTHSRLTRELLDQQASSGILLYNPDDDTYALSGAGAMVMAEQESPVWLAGGLGAVRAMYVGLDRVEAAFRGDGGISWGDHHPSLFEGLRFCSTQAKRVGLNQ